MTRNAIVHRTSCPYSWTLRPYLEVHSGVELRKKICWTWCRSRRQTSNTAASSSCCIQGGGTSQHWGCDPSIKDEGHLSGGFALKYFWFFPRWHIVIFALRWVDSFHHLCNQSFRNRHLKLLRILHDVVDFFCFCFFAYFFCKLCS